MAGAFVAGAAAVHCGTTSFTIAAATDAGVDATIAEDATIAKDGGVVADAGAQGTLLCGGSADCSKKDPESTYCCATATDAGVLSSLCQKAQCGSLQVELCASALDGRGYCAGNAVCEKWVCPTATGFACASPSPLCHEADAGSVTVSSTSSTSKSSSTSSSSSDGPCTTAFACGADNSCCVTSGTTSGTCVAGEVCPGGSYKLCSSTTQCEEASAGVCCVTTGALGICLGKAACVSTEGLKGAVQCDGTSQCADAGAGVCMPEICGGQTLTVCSETEACTPVPPTCAPACTETQMCCPPATGPGMTVGVCQPARDGGCVAAMP